MKKEEVIDHIQEAPLYFYDYNYFSNTTNARMKKTKKLKYNSKEYKEYVKNLIYCKIIESWKASDRLIKNNKKPQFNNCFYNLKELDKRVNRNIKAKIIDKSLYFNTYLPKPQVNALVRINEPIKTR